MIPASNKNDLFRRIYIVVHQCALGDLILDGYGI